MGIPRLTLLGFSPRTYPILVELAADSWGLAPEELRVRVVLNLPKPEPSDLDKLPAHWMPPNFCSLEEWEIEQETGIIMPGTMHEPAVSVVWDSIIRAKPGLKKTRLGVVAHPSAAIAPNAKIGNGTWIHPNVTVSSLSEVGFCCHLNRNSSLGHHNVLGDFSRLNPGAHTAGFCIIGSRTTIGIGAVCIEKVSIGSRCMVGAGAVVVSDGVDHQEALGVPAKWRGRV